MKTIAASLFLALIVVSAAFGQAETEKRVIEVSGSAETLITPNEFTFKVTILERMEKKEKLTIETQEASLRSELSRIGLDPAEDLSVYDISSRYIPQKKVRDVLGSKDYSLKVRDISKIAPLIELIDRLNISKLDLIDTTHTELTRFRRETKMEAIKAAKEKAIYLLGAIGERAGKPTFVKEIDEETARLNLSGVNSNSNSFVSNYSRTSSSSSDSDSDLSFEQIKLRFVILAKFEIE
jgi:uncharacterized protein